MILKYLISGSTAAVALFTSLVIFREVLGLWYLYSSTLAFCIAMITSFVLQKFWTFKNTENKNMPRQFLFFLAVSLCNLAVNAALMYVAVDLFAVPYIIAQFAVTGLIAFFTFFIYRDIVFRRAA